MTALVSNNLITPQYPDRGLVRFVGTTDAAGSAKAIYTNPGTDPVDVVGLIVTNGATAHTMSVIVTSSATAYTVNDVSVAAHAGQDGTVTPVNFLSPANWPGLPLDGNGNPFFRLGGSDTLSLQYATAQGTADTIYGYLSAVRYTA